MTLKSIMKADVKEVLFDNDFVGITGKYSSKDGSVVSASITAVLNFDSRLSPTEYGAAEMATLMVSAADVASPAIYDTFTSDSVTYTVKSRLTGGANGLWVLIVEADQRQKPRNA